MGNKKVKSKRKTELRIIFFIILVAAAIFIVSTYAWFSTQRNVSITNLSGIVEVAEGLEISLDAEKWANEIVLGDDMNIIDNAYTGHRNVSPKEMLPVSTLGKPSKATSTDLTMIRGTVNNSIELRKIVAADESLYTNVSLEQQNAGDSKYPGYFAFDIFLKNSSKQYDKDDQLQLNYDSSLRIIEGGNDEVGLENTVRVALAKYGTGEIISGEGEKIVRAGVANVMADQATILDDTGALDGDVYIDDVAIWEPNSSDHVEFIVTNNNKITWSASDGVKYGTYDETTGKYLFAKKQKMPTYALKDTALTANTTINDIYKWDGSEANLAKQVALQTTKKVKEEGTTDYTQNEGVQNLFSAYKTKTDNTTPSDFSIAPNSIVRLRIYVWLEGQDVDCINYASHGGGITLNLGLVKGSTIGATEETVE